MASKADPSVPSESLYELAFDQFSRQYLVKRLVEKMRTRKALRILDVGGNNGKTREFFPTDEVLIVDLYDKIEPGYLKASALDLPFEDQSFDIVLSFDVYEHILPDDRDRFITELIRVSSRAAIIAAPFNTDSVAAAETELNDYYKSLNNKDHQWLIEHIDNTLPDIAPLERLIASLKVNHKVYQSNNIPLWNAMQSFIFLADSISAPERISNLNRFYNRHLLELGDNLESSYRKIYLMTPSNDALPDLNDRSQFSPKTLRKFINLAAEGMHELMKGTEAAQLAAKDREIAFLQSELKGIRASRPYKLARLVTDSKNKVLRKR